MPGEARVHEVACIPCIGRVVVAASQGERGQVGCETGGRRCPQSAGCRVGVEVLPPYRFCCCRCCVQGCACVRAHRCVRVNAGLISTLSWSERRHWASEP